MSVVLCQHLTPELLRRPAWLRHANGARGVSKVIGMVRDLASAHDSYVTLFGAPCVELQNDRLVIRAGRNQAIELVTPEAALNLWFAKDSVGDADRLLSVNIAVHDADATERYFASSGVTFERSSGGTVRVDARDACGVPLEFTDHA
jgi:hypothetical protein